MGRRSPSTDLLAPVLLPGVLFSDLIPHLSVLYHLFPDHVFFQLSHFYMLSYERMEVGYPFHDNLELYYSLLIIHLYFILYL